MARHNAPDTTFRKQVQRTCIAVAGLTAWLACTTAMASDAGSASAAMAASDQTAQSNNPKPASCAKRYHAKLGTHILPKAEATQTIADEMRRSNPDLPGYWLFWDGSGVLARNARQQRLLASQSINIRDNRMCVRSILARGGRIRCLKWQPIPPGYVPPKPKLPTVDPNKPEISAAERRIASRIASRVSRKGAFRELEHGTAFYHLAQRTSDELIAYARQPYRSALCSGAKEMIDFYRRQLAPLYQKTERAKQLHDETRTAALATARVHLSNTGNGALPRKNISYSNIAKPLMNFLLNKEERALLAAAPPSMETLRQIREKLSDQRISEIPTKQRSSLKKALRNIEFAIYARYNWRRLQRFSEAYDATFEAIRSASRSECTCSK